MTTTHTTHHRAGRRTAAIGQRADVAREAGGYRWRVNLTRGDLRLAAGVLAAVTAAAAGGTVVLAGALG